MKLEEAKIIKIGGAMENNKDKDIEIVEELINRTDLLKKNRRGKQEIKFEVGSNYYNSISNLLNRLKEYDSKIIHLSDEEYRKVIDNAQAELQSELAIKDKMIDLLLDRMVRVHSENPEIELIANFDIEHKKRYAKEYFRKEAESNK